MPRRRRSLLLLLLFAGLLIACSSDALAPTNGSSTPTAEQAPTLRVASINMLHGFDSEVNASTCVKLTGMTHYLFPTSGVSQVHLRPPGCVASGFLARNHAPSTHTIPRGRRQTGPGRPGRGWARLRIRMDSGMR